MLTATNTRRNLGEIEIRLHKNDANRDEGIFLSKRWNPTLRKMRLGRTIKPQSEERMNRPIRERAGVSE
ncbi:hypothetical protein J437_LFUL016861 [Ladona fulva]|uniref:Uncharacterized protein n=1 Tax=Ladona fulva TaxID=123851 RepID=A0A8K0P7B7_LADFU|nr:hypothetical protein J437_LFUL016861 [Ladona fulva]